MNTLTRYNSALNNSPILNRDRRLVAGVEGCD
jgi:hypothetical protein